MKPKGWVWFGLIVLFCFCLSRPVAAAEDAELDTVINRQLDVLNLDAVDREAAALMEQSGEGRVEAVSLRELVASLLKGELDLSPSALLQKGLDLLLGEFKGQMGLMRNLLLIVLLAALLKTLNASFQGKSVGELGFYVCYVVLILLIMATFSTGAALVRDTTEAMSGIMEGMLPVFTALSLSSGNYTYAVAAGPIIIAVAQLLSKAIRFLVLPAITLVTVLELTNHLSEKKLLSEMTSFLKTLISWGLKGSAMAFMLLLSLLKIGTPALNQLIGKTAKTAVGAVPVVGEVMTGAVDMAATLAGMTQNGLVVGVVIVLLLVSLVPILRLVAMIFLYKVTAAVVEPVSESRLVKALSAAGDFSLLLLGALFAAEVMFLFAVLAMMTIF